MNNPFTTSRENIQRLLADSQRRFVIETFSRALGNFTREKIKEQLSNQQGPIIDAISGHSSAFAADTANVEITASLSLADFYWPYSNTEISFELQNDVRPDSITSYEDLTVAIENNTHIDCCVVGDGIIRNFQIKRYPLAHLGDTNESFLLWL